MKALVTGGAGFIGSTVSRMLLQKGHDVVILDNFSTGHRVNTDTLPEARVVEGDVRDPDTVARAMEGADTVFHLAASVGNLRSIQDPLEDADVNVIGTVRVLEAARHAGVRKVVFSSSAAIFGDLKHLPIREDHPLDPDSPYGASKLAAEKLCLAYAKLFDLEAVCLRYFNVYGPNQRFDPYGNVIPIFAQRLLQGLPLVIYGDGEQTRDFVNVHDVARVNLLAAQASGVSGAFNIASGSAITVNALVEDMQRASGTNTGVEYSAPRQGDVRHSVADITAAREALGYEPTVGLKEGLAEYMTWVAE